MCAAGDTGTDAVVPEAVVQHEPEPLPTEYTEVTVTTEEEVTGPVSPLRSGWIDQGIEQSAKGQEPMQVVPGGWGGLAFMLG